MHGWSSSKWKSSHVPHEVMCPPRALRNRPCATVLVVRRHECYTQCTTVSGLPSELTALRESLPGVCVERREAQSPEGD